MAESNGVKEQRKLREETKYKILTKTEADQHGLWMQRIEKAVEQREQPTEFFDGLTYSLDYQLNRQAKNTYLRPKRNDSEVRINTGTTEKKIETVQNELLSLNLQPEVRAFDVDDLEIEQLGDNLNDIVKRTNEIEQDDDIWESAVSELLTQRAVFIEDRYVTRRAMGNKKYSRFEKRLISGLKVFLGDISIPLYRFNDQPYVCTYDRIHYTTAKTEFSKNKNWGYVKPGSPDTNWYSNVFGYRVGSLEEDEVEIIRCYSYPDNEWQVYVAGVPMLKPDEKLPYNYPGYPLRGFGLKAMDPDYTYCKPLTASSKALQMIDNETLRLLIRKFRQSLEPPKGVKGKKIFSKDIFAPGAMTHGIQENSMFNLVDHNGVNQSEMAMYDLITRKTEEFIGSSDVMQGIQPKGDPTATEIQAILRQGVKALGLAVLALMRMKRDMTYLRIYNVIEQFSKPKSKRLNPLTNEVEDVYQSFTIFDAELGDGKQGKKRIEFRDGGFSDEEREVLFENEKESEKMGLPIRFHAINIKKLANVPVFFYVTVSSAPKDSQALDKVMFKDKLNQAVAISQLAGRPIAGDKVVEDFERTWAAKGMFQDKTAAGLSMGVGEVMPGQNGQVSQAAQQLEQGAEALLQRPSVNTLSNEGAV